MKFVNPDTVRIDLKDTIVEYTAVGAIDENGTLAEKSMQRREKNWIEVKQELSAVEEKRFRTSGLKRMSQRKGDGDELQNDVEIDWAAMALARVTAYLVEWSAKKPDGSRLPVSRDAIGLLDSASFDEIDTAIQAHIEKAADAKKAPSGRPTLTAV